MENPSTSLFDVYLRLRPSLVGTTDRFLEVDPPTLDEIPKHITIKPLSNDFRKRAVEKFAFTRVFEEKAQQLDIFRGTGVLPLIEGVLGCNGRSRDGLLATLGVTGSGKSHTILGTKKERGLTQMSLHSIFQSISNNIVHPTCAASVFQSVAASDVSEAQMSLASLFLDPLSDAFSSRGSCSRAQTPMIDASFMSVPAVKSKLPPLSALPKLPDMEGQHGDTDPAYEYVVVVSMYEVYNDRIFDLLAGQATGPRGGAPRRRALLFKNTESSADRKVVAGLRKVMCCTLEEALMVLETGLLERKVAGTGSNAVSSRSHGFFCVEVKKRHRVQKDRWDSRTLTIVDLAGSERARTAKTAGATLAEAGKINESLMYLGQCMQMQSEIVDRHKAIVPFRQCKLTELLFSNSFPSQHHNAPSRSSPTPQKAIMIVTADPTGDFNATSQILRYSALAREITVPRIPSVTSQLLAAQAASAALPSPRPGSSSSSSVSELGGSSNISNSATSAALRDQATEISRLADEIAVLSVHLEEERCRREQAELSWAAVVERLADVEAAVRDECWAEVEDTLEAERTRWRAVWEAEAERGEERVDRKIAILAAQGPEATEQDQGQQAPLQHNETESEQMRLLAEENERLRARIEAMERERLLRTPSMMGKKQRVLKTRKWESEEDLETSA